MIEFNIMPRRSGKTTILNKALKEFSAGASNAMLINTRTNISVMESLLREDFNNIDILLLDDYLFFDDKLKLLILKWYRKKTILKAKIKICSTSNKLYDYSMVNYIKKIKKHNIEIMSIDDMLTMFRKENHELIISLLTEPWVNMNEHAMSPDIIYPNYQTEILGKIWL